MGKHFVTGNCGANTQKEGIRKRCSHLVLSLPEGIWRNPYYEDKLSAHTLMVQASNLLLFVILLSKSPNFSGSTNKLATLTFIV